MKSLFTSAASANKRAGVVLVIFGALLPLMRNISTRDSAQSLSPQLKTSALGAKSLLVVLAFLVAVIFLMNNGPGRAQSSEDRVLEDLIPKHVPIKIKIKGEKEKAFKNLKNEKWHRDFELEVENVGDKDIYFLELWVVFPEIISENGHEVGIPLRYGRSEFIHFDAQIRPQDLPIRPGASQTFDLPENYRKGWEAHKARENRPNPKRVQIKFVQLSFGDGTGFNGTDAMPYPYVKKQFPLGACREGPNQPDDRLRPIEWETQSRVPAPIRKYPLSSTPAEFLPVKFSLARTIYASNAKVRSPPEPCCPGTSCSFRGQPLPMRL